MAQPVVVDIGLDPVAVGALGAQRIVGHAHALADAIHQAGLMGCRVGCRVVFDGCRHGAVSWLWPNVIRQNPLLNWSSASLLAHLASSALLHKHGDGFLLR